MLEHADSGHGLWLIAVTHVALNQLLTQKIKSA